MSKEIWIEKRGDVLAVRWSSNGLTRIQSCANEEQARSFVAGFEEGLEEAKRLLADEQPRFRSAAIRAELEAKEV